MNSEMVSVRREVWEEEWEEMGEKMPVESNKSGRLGWVI